MKMLLTAILISICMPVIALGQGTQTREAAEKELKEIRRTIEEKDLNFSVELNDIILNYTPEERESLLGLELPDNWRETWQERLPDNFMAKSAKDLPPMFSWVQEGKITPVKDQKSCGSCWIFCAVADIEAAYMIRFDREYDLSEQDVISCYATGWGCNAGWWDYVYSYVQGNGIILEGELPYYADDEVPCPDPRPLPIATINDWIAIPEDVNSIKTALLNGPVVSAFTVKSDFYGYSSGCYSTSGDNIYDINHGVLIVGWNDYACMSEHEPVGAWQVKNSWGAEWGNNGYFWVAYGNSGIGFYASQSNIDGIDILLISNKSDLPGANFCDDNYNTQLFCNGGIGRYRWSIVEGKIPPGLILESNGAIHGDPIESGLFTFMVKVEDSSNPPLSTNREFQIYVEPCLNGDADCSGEYDVLDIVYLIDNKFKQGPPPIAGLRGCDCDCSYGCDILDITYLIDFKFKDDDQPCQYHQ